jgi:hypothetical protein
MCAVSVVGSALGCLSRSELVPNPVEDGVLLVGQIGRLLDAITESFLS